MPPFRTKAATLPGFFRALAEADRLPPRVLARAVLPAVRLAWDRGGGRAIGELALPPQLRDREKRPVYADDAEAALEAFERWVGGEEIPLADRRAYRLLASGVSRATLDLHVEMVSRRCRFGHPGEAMLLGQLARLAQSGDRRGREDLGVEIGYHTAGALAEVGKVAGLELEDEFASRGAVDKTQAAAVEAALALFGLGHSQILPGPGGRGLQVESEQMVLAMLRAGLFRPQA